MPGFEWKIKLISKASGSAGAGLAGPVCYTSRAALSAPGAPRGVITGDVTATIAAMWRFCTTEPDRLLKQ